MIEVSHLSKRYGHKYAVNDISFRVNKGEILGFLGPNGAGKTTTMNIITGYLSSSDGTVKVDGIDVLEDPISAKRKIGFLPEQPPLYLEMTIKEYLNFVCDIKQFKEDRKKHLEEICELIKITDVYHRVIKNLSKGYRQRVGLAQALVGKPEVLILDEPTVGLDPRQIIDIRNLIKDLGKEHTIILSSHILPEVQAVCERVLVINKGVIVADDTPENLSKNMTGSRRFIARIAGDSEQILAAVKAMPDIKYAEMSDSKEPGTADYVIEGKAGTDVRYRLFELVSKNNWSLLELKSMDLTLEDIFLQLVNKEENVESQASGGEK